MAPTLKLRGHHETKTQTIETRQEPVRREKTTEKPRAQPETKKQPADTEHDPVVALLQLRRPTADYRDLEKMQATVTRHEAARNEKKTQPAQSHEKKMQAVETRKDPAAPVLRLRRETANPLDLQKMQTTQTREQPNRHEKTEKPRDRHQQEGQTAETPQKPISPQPQWVRRQTADARDLQKMKDIAAQWEASRHKKEKTKKPTDHHHEKNTQPVETRQDPVVPTLRLRRETADVRDLEKMKTTETNRQEPAPLPTKSQTTTTTTTTAPSKPTVLVKKTDKIRDFFEKKKQPTLETRRDPAPLPTAPKTTAAAPAAPAKSAVVAKMEGRGGQLHEMKTERLRDHHEMKTQSTEYTRQDSAVPQPLKITKTRDHDEKMTERSGAQAEKTQTTETRQDPAPAPPRPSPAAQKTTTTAANTAAAAPSMSSVMAKAALKSSQPHGSQSNQAKVLERYNRTGDRQRYADVSERNPFRSVSPLRKPTRNNLEGWPGHEMNTSDWPPEKPEVKEASETAAAAQEPPQRPSVLAQVEACVPKVRDGRGIHTPVEEITKIWHKIRRDDDTETNQNQTIGMSNVPPTRKDDETAEKMEHAKQEDELKKKFWEKLDRTLGLHQVRPHDDRDGDKKRREKGRISLILTRILAGLMGLSFFAWLVTIVAFGVALKEGGAEFVVWPVLSVVGLFVAANAHARAKENVDSARYDEEIARQRELQVERASRGLGPEFEAVGDPSKNEQQVLRVFGGAEGSGANASAAVPEGTPR
ncbi:hypothetical protein CPLU01_04221 [Colletotrichum plurivorum]|uniref:Uncharacterized protein n=1 Tax=Colletotrichum plurivorum TaxID=2175906 RepID=A0A8H6KQT2_9PEZI|nr:hypothetical protein CPLU01_04221 [Colletotrichum plurivorum]